MSAITEDETKKRRKESAEAKKKQEAAEVVLEDAQSISELASLEKALAEAETGGYDLYEQTTKWTDLDDLARAIELKAAEARRAYVESFILSKACSDCSDFHNVPQPNCKCQCHPMSRYRAGWAAKKISEAKTTLEDVKERMKAEVRRAERCFEGRKGFYEAKVEAFAKGLPREATKCPECKGEGKVVEVGPLRRLLEECDKCGGTGKILARVVDRFPEHGVRLELRPKKEGGAAVVDSAAALDGLLQILGKKSEEYLGIVMSKEQRAESGLIEAFRLGLLKPLLQENAFLQFYEGLGQPPLDGVEVTPEEEVEKLTIVRM